jgi:Pectate lyase superfamily protein
MAFSYMSRRRILALLSSQSVFLSSAMAQDATAKKESRPQNETRRGKHPTAALRGILFADPQVKPLSTTGQPLAGAHLLFYLTGTTTPAEVYADGALTTPLSQSPGAAQPSCTADSAGRFNPIYLNPATTYRVQLYSAGGSKLEDTDPYVVPGFAKGPASVMDYGAIGDGLTDDSIAIQNAINANPRGLLTFPARKFKISSQINILNGCKLQGVRGLTTIILATQNQHGFVVGDGTSATRSTAIHTTIDGFAFNPSSSVAAFTSGQCIYLKHVEFVSVTNCHFYGSNGASNVLYNGMLIFQGSEVTVSNNYFYHLRNFGLYASGGGADPLRTVDGRFDFNEFTGCGNDCLHLDANCAGCTINFMVAYEFSTWGIVLNTGVTGAGSLHYICQPDIEADSASGAINIQNSANVDISGGWCGTPTGSVTPVLWIQSASNTVKVTGIMLENGTVQVDGAACTFTGCDVVGDDTTNNFGFIISRGATDTSITGGRVRQHLGGGIQFSSTPPAARCKIVGVNIDHCGPRAGTGYEVVGSIGSPGSILGASGTPAALPPVIRDCQSDVPFAFAAGTNGKIVTSVGRDFLQVTASANITTMTPLSLGNRVTLQAGTGGFTLASGGNIELKTSPMTVSSGGTLSFVGDGISWFQD